MQYKKSLKNLVFLEWLSSKVQRRSRPIIPNQQNRRKSSAEECVLWLLSFKFLSQINKNSLLQSYFTALVPTGYFGDCDHYSAYLSASCIRCTPHMRGSVIKYNLSHLFLCRSRQQTLLRRVLLNDCLRFLYSNELWPLVRGKRKT